MRAIIRAFVNNPTWANVFMFSTIIIGIIGFFTLNRSYFPETRVKDIYIEVINPGTSPTEMEEGVTIKIEESLKGIVGIEEYTSTTSENYTQVHILVLRGYDVDEVLSDVKNAVDQINSFPVNAEEPKVYKRKPLTQSIRLNLYGATDRLELKKVADLIESDFLNTGFISQINISGIPEMEISVEIGEETLEKYGFTIADIANAISSENRDISGGSIKTKNEELLIRSESKTTKPNELENVIIRANEDGSFVYLRDVAKVSLQLAETSAITTYKDMPTIGIDVNKLPEEDILKITDYVKDYVETFNQVNSAIQLFVQYDYSVSLNQRIDLLVKNGLIGLLLVVVTLGIFLNLRLALWVALGIPISFLGMFFLANLVGITINQITLFGMIVVIGILVDDGIVIAENIYAKVERGINSQKAAIEGTTQVLPSVITSVITTIVAFSIFFFLNSSIGEFLKEMGIVVILCLGYSLLEAATILPSHLRHVHVPKKESRFRKSINKGVDYTRKRIYGKFVRFGIRYRWLMLIVPLAFLMIVGGLMGGKYIKSSLFPFIDSDFITFDLELTPGKRAYEVQQYLQKVDSATWVVNELYKDELDGKDIVEASRIDVSAQGHTGSLNVKLLDGVSRNNILSTEVANKIKKIVGKIPEARKFTTGGRTFFGKPVSITFIGKDLTALNMAKNDLKSALEQIPDLRDVIDNNELGKREIKLQLKSQAYALGLSTGMIATQIRNRLFGKEVQRLQLGADEVKLWVRYPEKDRSMFAQLDQLKIFTPQGGVFPLNTLATYTIQRELVNIKHYNGAREVTVEASLMNPDTPLDPISDQIKTEIIPKILTKYPSIRTKEGGQERERTKLSESFIIVIPVGLFIIYMLLVTNFRSFAQPIIVLGMIPIGIAGALFGHFFEGKVVVIMSYLGILALAGVIVNDAVVFLDRYNENIRNGLSTGRSVYEAAISRFRPILLTSITTVVGLYPLIFEKSRQAQFLVPMAISVAWGILIGTIFILLLFPSFIMILNDLRYILRLNRYKNRENVEPAFEKITPKNDEKSN